MAIQDLVSLRELRERVLFLHMTHPQDNTEWARVQMVTGTVGGLTQRVQEAIRLAIEANPWEIHDVLTSESLGSVARAIPLPPRVSRVIRVAVQEGDERTDGLVLKHWHYEAVAMTPVLFVEDVLAASTALNIHYVYTPRRLPIADFRIGANLSSGASRVYVTGAQTPPEVIWPGYIELTVPWCATTAREIVFYNAVSDTAFDRCSRGVEGVQRPWTMGCNISNCVEIPSGMINVISRVARANLYEWLIQDRELYPAYRAVAGDRATPAEELAAVIGLERALAREDRHAVKRNLEIEQARPAHPRRI